MDTSFGCPKHVLVRSLCAWDVSALQLVWRPRAPHASCAARHTKGGDGSAAANWLARAARGGPARGCPIEWRVVWAAPWPCGPPRHAAMCRAGSRRSSQEEEKHVLWWELTGFGRFWSKLCSTQHDVSQFDRMRGRHHAQCHAGLSCRTQIS